MRAPPVLAIYISPDGLCGYAVVWLCGFDVTQFILPNQENNVTIVYHISPLMLFTNVLT